MKPERRAVRAIVRILVLGQEFGGGGGGGQHSRPHTMRGGVWKERGWMAMGWMESKG